MLLNDADVQGLAVIKGKGLELVATLGTGLGTAWFRDGELLPHLELAHVALHKKTGFRRLYRRQPLARRSATATGTGGCKKVIPVLADRFQLRSSFPWRRQFAGGSTLSCRKM